ncbi:MAG: PAS domain-containing protein [Deltaproteobacteria bacterium]|nr:PAS domain-containing protein [Deltaproteobacteria bacterium]
MSFRRGGTQGIDPAKDVRYEGLQVKTNGDRFDVNLIIRPVMKTEGLNLFEIVPVGVSVLDGEGRIVYVNPALEKMLDVPRADLLRKDYRQQEFLRPDGSPMAAEESAGARAIKEQRLVEHVGTGVVKKDGRIIRTDMNPVPMALPGWKAVVVTFNLGEQPGRKKRSRNQRIDNKQDDINDGNQNPSN